MATSIETESNANAAAPAAETPAPKQSATALARANLPPEALQQIEMNRMKNLVTAGIKGTAWGKNLSPESIRAVAEYARENNLDAVRHIEILGGKIYLTAELYEERGAPLMQAGWIRKDLPDYINVDERLDKLATAGSMEAKKESERRLMERIRWNVPESAVATCVQKLWIKGVVTPVVGVNWCGGGSRQNDPVGNAEPTKTAATRAARRAWKQIVEVIQSYGSQFQQMEAHVDSVNEVIVDFEKLAALQSEQSKPKAIAASTSGGYGVEVDAKKPEPAAIAVADHGEDPFE